MGIRQLILVTHRWVGLATSVVLAIVGGTGALIVWEMPFRGFLRRFLGRLHESLGFSWFGGWPGFFGDSVVNIATALAVVLQLGGLALWWKRKTLYVTGRSGLWRLCFDLHHSIGIVLIPLMLVLAVTGTVMAFSTPKEYPVLWPLMRRFHTGHFGFPIEVVYAIASLGFVAQGVTGVVVWWKPRGKS